MIIITSAAYVSPELIAEFGKLPPSMLPVQNKRLFRHQLELFDAGEQVVISLPCDYKLSESDKIYLDQARILVVYVPLDLSLGQSLVYVLNVMGKYDESVKILHGDTLFNNIPVGSDFCIIAEEQINYSWSHSSGKDQTKVYAGFFSFSDQSLLIRKITEHEYSFIDGLESYRVEKHVEEIYTDSWLDFGLLNSYYRSRSFLTTQRVFNDLHINEFSVQKSSNDNRKIMAEAMWLKNAPRQLKPFLPALWDYGKIGTKSFYEIEYFYLSTLSDLYVFGNQPIFVWKKIINSCSAFINICVNESFNTHICLELSNEKLYSEKTFTRLREYALQAEIELNQSWIINGISVPSINEIVFEMNAAISNPERKHLSITHGDFCFSNILYNFKTESIKVIDPRGLDFDGEENIYGDLRYDVAKLAHSVIGLYDFIIGGCFKCIEIDKYNLLFEIQSEKNVEDIQEYFKSQKFGNMSLDELNTYPILVHLFLSMLPLHIDHPQKQKAMLANALKIYAEYKERLIV
jgi:hypothetical protein